MKSAGLKSDDIALLRVEDRKITLERTTPDMIASALEKELKGIEKCLLIETVTEKVESYAHSLTRKNSY